MPDHSSRRNRAAKRSTAPDHLIAMLNLAAMIGADQLRTYTRYSGTTDELIEKTDRLKALQRRRDAILDRMTKVRIDRSMAPFEKGAVLSQLETASMALLNDIVALKSRVNSLARELDL